MRFLILALIVAFALGAPSKDEIQRKSKNYHAKHTERKNAPKAASEDKAFWLNDGQTELQNHLNNIVQNTNVAKNIIFFIGDGMGLSTMTGIRLYKGYQTGNYEREKLAWETFPNSGVIKTYNTDMMTTDSAASATAYHTGVKGNQGTLGVDANVLYGDCSSVDPSFYTTSVLEDFQVAGASTGIITTTRVTHASPAGAYVKSCSRHYESDFDQMDSGGDPDGPCQDTAWQLMHGQTGSNINVIMGGGRKVFHPTTSTDAEDKEGERLDGENLFDVWKATQDAKGAVSQYVQLDSEFDAIDTSSLDYLLGLFDNGHMKFNYEVDANDRDPTLPEMVQKAIEILQKNPNGFYLFVEGGLIDKAHHLNQARSALIEGRELEKAVKVAMDLTSESDTLIVVSADHGQPMIMNGYQPRRADVTDLTNEVSDIDGKKLNTLMYGNGPGYRGEPGGERPDPETEDTKDDDDYTYPATVINEESYHSPEDVIVWARGPYSHLFTGSHENSYIAHAMRYAACVGDGLHSCATSRSR